MLIGLAVRAAGLDARGVVAPLLVSDIGDGNMSFALSVGDSGVGKPGYFLPISVKMERFGLTASGLGRAPKPPMLNTGPSPLRCGAEFMLLVEPSKEDTRDSSRLCASLCTWASAAGKW